MKNNNHTQGEWHLKSVNGIKYVQDKNNRYLATVHSLEDGKNNDERREESEANARLIVKAVNNHEKLIETLKLTYEYFSKFGFEWEGRNTTEGQYILAHMRSTLDSFGEINFL